MKYLLVRFSAIGDVAMIAPVLKGFAEANPEAEFLVVSRPFAKAFFEGIAPNVTFCPIDPKNEKYKGVLGLERLYMDVRALKADVFCDLHDVIRTKYLRMRFRLARVPVYYINKHREGKRTLVRDKNKVLIQQPTSFDNYSDVLVAAGLKIGRAKGPILDLSSLSALHPSVSPRRCVGIAPFAAHQGKVYPVALMRQVIRDLLKRNTGLHIFLFGGGKKDELVFQEWEKEFSEVEFISKKCSNMREEMAVMQQLSCMVTMDSGNMHMASLVGVPVVSIWGATHPYAGFMGWQQKEDDAIQLDLPCRPCSIYGNKPCLRGDYACLNGIAPDAVVVAVEKYL